VQKKGEYDIFIKMKVFSNSILICLFFFLASFSAFTKVPETTASTKKISFSVEPTFAYSKSMLNEIFYQSTDKSKKRSLLEWERNIFLYGINTHLKYKKFSTSLSLESSVRGECGSMYDSDWLNLNDYNMKTTYSWGANNAEENYNTNLIFKYKMYEYKNFFFSPSIAFQYQYDSFSRKLGAQGGYGQSEYSSDHQDHWWYEEEAKKYPTERYWSEEKQAYVREGIGQIDYSRHSVFLWTGIDIGYSNKYLNFLFNTSVSPFIYFSAADTHHGKTGNETYHQIQDSNFTAVKFTFLASVFLSKNLEFNTKLLYISTKTLRGDLYYGWAKNRLQDSGASYNEKKIQVGLKYRFCTP